MHVVLGTPEYYPPEMYTLSQNPYGYDPRCVDVFHLGIQLFLLAFGQVPFLKATASDEYYFRIAHRDVIGFVKIHPAFRGKRRDEINFELVSLAIDLMAYVPS
jgi:serine/threonine protein kinase